MTGRCWLDFIGKGISANYLSTLTEGGMMKRITFLRKSVFGLGIIPILPLLIKSLFSKPTYTLPMFQHDLHKPGRVLDLWPPPDTPFMRFVAEHGVKNPVGEPELKMFEYLGDRTEIKEIEVERFHID